MEESTQPTELITWHTSHLTITLTLDSNGAPCIQSLHAPTQPPPKFTSPYFSTSALPLNNIRAAGQNQGLYKTAKCLVGSVLSSRLRYIRHVEHETDTSHSLDVVSHDEPTGLEVTHHFEVFKGTEVLRSWTTVKNGSQETQTLDQVSSLTIGGLTAGTEDWCDGYSVLTANNTWFRELQWQERGLVDVGIDEVGLHALKQGHKATMASFSLSNRGTMTTEKHIPMGALKRKDSSHTWLWQIEAGGSWRWEIGDWQDSLYLAAGGPTLVDHAWQLDLAPGESFTSPPVAICRTEGGIDNAFAAMNEYRKCVVRPHPDHDSLPIIFNDYMNCLMGDPNEAKIQALLQPAVHCGASYYVIDAGWYADAVDVDWWDTVGAWEPSPSRFPSGFKALISSIRDAGLVPGVWLEPEVMGVRSVAASQLPPSAFFQERGRRLEERSRWQLDYSHPAVRSRMHSIVAGLVHDYGIQYFKFDYNIDVLTGTDAHARLSTGAALLQHQRAYMSWIDELFARHPGLIIENCASGGQRMEYGYLASHTLQSTSDQQDPYLYAAVAAAAPTGVLPQQSASWAYPQREWTDEKNAFTVVNSLMGRVHLSGRLDALTPHQLDLVQAGMDVYRSIRHDLVKARPFWPLGLPRWRDDWVALGMLVPGGTSALVAVWRRAGATELKLDLAAKGAWARVEVLYPTMGFETRVSVEAGVVVLGVPGVPCARLLRVEV